MTNKSFRCLCQPSCQVGRVEIRFVHPPTRLCPKNETVVFKEEAYPASAIRPRPRSPLSLRACVPALCHFFPGLAHGCFSASCLPFASCSESAGLCASVPHAVEAGRRALAGLRRGWRPWLPAFTISCPLLPSLAYLGKANPLRRPTIAGSGNAHLADEPEKREP